MKTPNLSMALVLAMIVMRDATQVSAGVFTVVAFNGDADSGIATNKTYTHRLNFNTSSITIINGVGFTPARATGNDLFSGAAFVLSLPADETFDYFDSNPNIATGQFHDVFSKFFHNAQRHGQNVSLGGLTPGLNYDTRFYSVPFYLNGAVGAPGTRIVTVSNGSDAITYNEDGGVEYLSYVFVASTDSTTFVITTDGFNPFNNFALSNEVIPTPGINRRFTKTRRSGNDVVFEWIGGGSLQSANVISGPWADIAGASNPYTNSPAGSQKFYRLGGP